MISIGFTIIGAYIAIMASFGSFPFDPVLLCAFIPIKSYSNAEADKSKILKENTTKSGIYMWTNLINGKKICWFF
jgi:hypothetical protein